MKRLIAFLLVTVMAAGMTAGCAAPAGESPAPAETKAAETKAAETQAAPAAEGKEYNITYLTPSTASQFWTYVGVGITNAAKDLEEEHGIKVNLNVVGPQEEAQTEEYVTKFEEVIASQPDAIVTATLAIDATVPKAMEATEAKIVLNFVNCGLGAGDDGANQDYYNQFYYCSNDTIGEMAGQAFLEACKNKGVEAGTIGVNMNVINEALNHRVDAFRDYITKNAPGGIKLTEDTYYNDNVVETAQSNAENEIATFDDLIGMYAGNNITGDGVCNAIEAAASAGKIDTSKFVAVAVDSDDIEIAAMKNGYLDALIVQDAYDQGYKCMENAILTLLNGSNPESAKQVNCPPVIITADNMESEEMLDLLDPTRLAK